MHNFVEIEWKKIFYTKSIEKDGFLNDQNGPAVTALYSQISSKKKIVNMYHLYPGAIFSYRDFDAEKLNKSDPKDLIHRLKTWFFN